MPGLRGGRGKAKNARDDTNVDSLISTLVAKKVKDALADVATSSGATPRQPATAARNKQLFSERSESDAEETPGTPSSDAINDAVPPPQKKQTTEANSTTKYASQVVILEGVKDEVKNHPTRLSQAFAAAKPDVKIKGMRLTATNSTSLRRRILKIAVPFLN
jgi:ribosomal protein L12E/L44/L45/RPP1/RPP2